MAQNKTPIDWKNHLVSFFFVTLGVIIAFGLNQWNEVRNEQKETRLFLEGLVEELKDNKKELEEAVPYHEDLLKTLREKPLEARLSLSPPALSTSAWELAQNNVFKSHVDHELYKKLAAVYKIHDGLMMQITVSGERMSEVNIMGPFYYLSTIGREPSEDEKNEFRLSTRKGWIPVFETWTYYEGLYLKKINEVLALIEEKVQI